MELNFKHLRYFQVIANEGSISKASRKLHVTQSTMSDQLRQLEEHLGVKLFDRKARRLILNRDGRLALDYAAKIFKLASDLEGSMNPSVSNRVTLVRVGIIPSLSKTHVQEFVLPLWKAKGLTVRVREGSSPYLVRELELGNLDVVLSDAAIESPSGEAVSRQLLSRTIFCVAHPKLRSLKKGFPASLDRKPFVNFTNHSHVRAQIDHYLDQSRVRPDLAGEVDDVNLARIMIERSPGFAFLPKRAVQDSIARGSLVALSEVKSIRTELWAMLPSSGPSDEVLSAIKRFKGRRV